MKRVVVIGGGVTGLSAAHRIGELDASVEVVVLEAGDRAGGMLRTERTEDGFVIERGPDSILTSKPAAIRLAERIGLGPRIVRTRPEARGAYVVSRGRLVRVPQGFNVVAPAALMSMWQSPILSARGKARAAFELMLPRGTRGPDESLESFVTRRYGAELLERLAQPMAAGIYGALPHRLSLRATMPRFLDLEDSDRSVTLGLMRRASDAGEAASGARYGLFISFDRGVGVLPEALAERLGDKVRLDSPVRVLSPEGSGWRIGLGATDLVADAVIVALGAPLAARLVKDWAPEAAAHLRAIRYGSAATVTGAWRRSDVPHPLDASGFVVPAIERRLVLASTWASEKWPGRAPADRVLIRVFLGGNDCDEIVRYRDDELVAVAWDGLRELMGIRAEPLLTRVDRYVDAMPRYEVDHLRRMDALDGVLAPHRTLALAGNAYRGVGIPDSVASGEAAAERLLGTLS